jgi:hypothetical protein
MNARLHTAAVARLTVATDPWLSCDDCFDGIDVVLEGMLARREPMPGAFRVHLLGCPVCHEEAEALATLVAADHGLSRFAARRIVVDVVGPIVAGGGRR